MPTDPWTNFRIAPTTPSADPWADFRQQPQAEPNYTQRAAFDVAKQIPSGLVAGIEAIPAAPAQAAGILGGLAEKILPSNFVSPEAKQQQLTLRDIIARQRGGGIAQYLPQPETGPGQFARTGFEMVPAAVGATTFSPLRAAGAGLTAGLTSEAAGQATAGTEAEPYARAGGALIGGGLALRQAESAAARTATPSIKQTYDRGGRLFDQFRESGYAVAPKAAGDFAATAKANLTQAGLHEVVPGVKPVWDALSMLESAQPGAVMTAQNMQAFRRTLGNLAGSADPSARKAAMQVRSDFDQFMSNPPREALLGGNPEHAAGLLREANANYAAAERASEASRRVQAAEARALPGRGASASERIQTQAANILANPRLQRGYSPQELAQVGRVATGTPPARVAEFVGRYMGGGGGLVPNLIGAAGLGGAYYTGRPELAALPIAGAGLRGLAGMSTMRQAKILEQMMRARSPLAAQTMPQITSPVAPFAFLPRTTSEGYPYYQSQ